MNKILTLLGSILIFTGLKAQDTTKVRKETTPVKEIKTKPSSTNSKVIPKVEGNRNAEGKVYPKIDPQYKVDANHKLEGKVYPKIDPQYKVDGKVYPKVENKTSTKTIKGEVIPKVETKTSPKTIKGEVIPKVESKTSPKTIKGEVIPKVETKIIPKKTGNQ